MTSYNAQHVYIPHTDLRTSHHCLLLCNWALGRSPLGFIEKVSAKSQEPSPKEASFPAAPPARQDSHRPRALPGPGDGAAAPDTLLS